MRATIAFALFLNLLVTSPVMAEVINCPPTAVAAIGALEKKFFAHAYDSRLSERVTRLERFVFGETRNNCPLAQRISRLTSTTGVPHAQPPGFSDKSISGAVDNPASKTLGLKKIPVESTYPRITNLERRLLGSTFEQQAVVQRLSRLECKVFGHTSSVRDLASRVDFIEEEAVASKFGSTSLSSIAMDGRDNAAARAGYYSQALPLNSNGSFQPDRQNYIDPYGHRAGLQQFMTGQRRNFTSTVDQIEFLEMVAFGRIRPNKRLEDRVEALERNLHRQIASNETLTNRVARIWAMASEQRKTSHL